jgi:GNAT superfamily N-acetyltransferase
MAQAPPPQPLAEPHASFRVDPAVEADLESVSQLAHDIWRRHYPGIISREQIEYMLESRYAPSRLRAESAKAGRGYLIARLGGIPVGFAALAAADDAPGEIVLRAFYLEPAHHGRGLGRRFMDHLTDLARNRGFQQVSLTVNRRNIKAINFYFKAGYQIRSAVDIAIGRGFTLNDFIMARRLV